MKIGTRSLLFGVHQFALHPLIVAIAWWQLFGFPWDPRLWVLFVVHDWGYWGCADMDGVEGTSHPWLGALIMESLFGPQWYDMALYHSRFYAKRDNHPVSKFCYADKWAIVVTPRWLWMLLARASGELYEYVAESRHKYRNMELRTVDYDTWHADVVDYIRRWVLEHKDGREDTWTGSEELSGK